MRKPREGDPAIVLCHPAPGSGVFDPGPAATWSRDVTSLAVDRPGYGRSDPTPAGAWATVASAAEDLKHVRAERGEPQVGLVGWGEGGWSALALAAQVPGLVHRLVPIGTPAPDEGLPYLPAGIRELIARLRGVSAAGGAVGSLGPVTACPSSCFHGLMERW